MTNNSDRLTTSHVTDATINVAGMTMEALSSLVESLGESAYRAMQIYDGLYRKRFTSWKQFSNLSRMLRTRLEKSVTITWPKLYASKVSSDGSVKYTFLLYDGNFIEGIYMPYGDRVTICLSSQVGCSMNCAFCATGSMGMKRNLLSAELIGQIIVILNDHNHIHNFPINLVFMGMGEPMHNLDQIMSAFSILTDDKGLGIAPKRVTLSTSGVVDGIRRLGIYVKRPRLAISLNATTDECRSTIMPVNRAWNLTDIMSELRQFPLRRNEHITIEYLLLKNITDSIADGQRLAYFAKQFPSKVNLIPFNPYKGSRFEPSSEASIDQICSILASQGITASVRRSRGQDVFGACGQMVCGL